jgi:hypothetical protein
MPPAAIAFRNSNCRNCIGIINGCSHFVQGVVLNGGRSPGMNTFAPQARQATIFNGFRVSFPTAIDVKL